MRDFENFLCFSSAMARCERAGSAEAQRKNKGNFQNRAYHLIIDERNEKTDLNLLRRKRSDFTFRGHS